MAKKLVDELTAKVAALEAVLAFHNVDVEAIDPAHFWVNQTEGTLMYVPPGDPNPTPEAQTVEGETKTEAPTETVEATTETTEVQTEAPTETVAAPVETKPTEKPARVPAFAGLLGTAPKPTPEAPAFSPNTFGDNRTSL